jgi:hypothetical protein
VHARLLAGGLTLILGMTLAAPPAFAVGGATMDTPRPIAAAATSKVAAMPAANLARAAQAVPAAPPGETGQKPFFRSTKGVLALVLLGGVLGYTVYSFSNDRVSSPQR